ncbi:SOS response-associated peptidase [Halorussus salilacus]|uniref:SOS response-associated peptidase n=1 Tax=Halorussus salilacus TaxID=2953750 RepID=UPI0020A0F1D0|nr:SOS response-associated peptidase [Halorussus salilacus]USZ66981.1 SOS response-associated peptidase [Halorussus salilacus]
MCGRTSLFAPPELVCERFDAEPIRPLEPRYNVSPGQRHPVVRNDATDEIRFPTWGLVPERNRDSGGRNANRGHINARAETLAEKPSFREAFAERRCLVLADGFYDWTETPTGKQPYRVERVDREPFAFAGLWEPSGGTDAEPATFAIVTTEPNAVVEPIHHRMPAMLRRGEESRWLREGDSDLLGPYPAEELRAYPVPDAVGNPKNDSPAVVEEVPAEEEVQTGLDEF